jgi:hypothetical protein
MTECENAMRTRSGMASDRNRLDKVAICVVSRSPNKALCLLHEFKQSSSHNTYIIVFIIDIQFVGLRQSELCKETRQQWCKQARFLGQQTKGVPTAALAGRVDDIQAKLNQSRQQTMAMLSEKDHAVLEMRYDDAIASSNEADASLQRAGPVLLAQHGS